MADSFFVPLPYIGGMEIDTKKDLSSPRGTRTIEPKGNGKARSLERKALPRYAAVRGEPCIQAISAARSCASVVACMWKSRSERMTSNLFLCAEKHHPRVREAALFPIRNGLLRDVAKFRYFCSPAKRFDKFRCLFTIHKRKFIIVNVCCQPLLSD